MIIKRLKLSLVMLLSSSFLLCVGNNKVAALQQADIEQQLEEGQFQQALQQIDIALENDKDNLSLQVMRADVIAASGKLEEAISLYQKMIKQNPEQAELYNNLAILLSNKGDHEAARDTLNQGLRTNKTYATIYENLSSIYMEMARDSYGKALQLDTRLQPLPLKKLAIKDDMIKVAVVNTPEPITAKEDKEQLDEIEELYPNTDTESKVTAEPVDDSAVQKTAVVNTPVSTTAKEDKEQLDEIEELYPNINTEQKVMAEPVDDSAVQKTAVVNTPVPATVIENNQQLDKIVKLNTSTEKKVTAEAVEISSVQQDVVDSLQAWAAAWSAQAVDLYLSFYDEGYQPKRGLSRSDWEAQRRNRLKRPEWIQIELDDIKVEITNENHAKVTLVQSYKSNTYQDKTRKQVSLIETNDGWRILKELSLGIVQ